MAVRLPIYGLLTTVVALLGCAGGLPADPRPVTSRSVPELRTFEESPSEYHASLYRERAGSDETSGSPERPAAADEAVPKEGNVSLIAEAESAQGAGTIDPVVGDVVHETLEDGTRIRYVVAHVEEPAPIQPVSREVAGRETRPALLPAPPAPARDTSDTSEPWEPGAMAVPAKGTGSAVAAVDPDVRELDLQTALALVGGRSPQVQIAHERVCEAYANWRAAKVLWLPSINAGLSYNRHDGTLQASNGSVADVDRSSLQTGLGAGAVGAGTNPVPGVVARFHAVDAWFQPLIAERTAAARRHAELAELNDQLLAAAVAYVELLDAEQRLAVARETLENTEDLVRVTTAFADSGQGNQADADRAETELSLRRNEVARAQEASALASARLAEVLSLDAAVRLRPLEPTLVPVELVVAESDLRGLVAEGLGRRPELHEQSALVGEAIRRLQREKSAPLVPSLLLGASYSGFGGGPGGRIDNFQDRVDFDALVTWEIRNLGYGEKAARDGARARVRRSRAERIRAMDRVAREIAEARARVVARRSQVDIARSGVTTAEQSHKRNVERIRQGEGLPIEVLQSIQALDAARNDLVRSISEFNEAQFRLHHALGWPIEYGIPTAE